VTEFFQSASEFFVFFWGVLCMDDVQTGLILYLWFILMMDGIVERLKGGR